MRTYEATRLEKAEDGRWFLRLPRRMYDLAGCQRRGSLYVGAAFFDQEGLRRYIEDRFSLFISVFSGDELKSFGYLEANLQNEAASLAKSLVALRDLDINVVECRSIDLGNATEGRVELLCTGGWFTHQLLSYERHEGNVVQTDPSHYLGEDTTPRGSAGLLWKPATTVRAREAAKANLKCYPVSDVFSVESHKDGRQEGVGDEIGKDGVLFYLPRDISKELTEADQDNYASVTFDSQTNIISIASRNERERNVRLRLSIPDSPGELLGFLRPLGARNVNLRFVGHERDYPSPDDQGRQATYSITANLSESKFSLFRDISLRSVIDEEVWWEGQRRNEKKVRGGWSLEIPDAVERGLSVPQVPQWRGSLELLACEGTRFSIKTTKISISKEHFLWGIENERGAIRYAIRVICPSSDGALVSLDLVLRVYRSIFEEGELRSVAEKAREVALVQERAAQESGCELKESGSASGFLSNLSDALYSLVLARSLSDLDACCNAWIKAKVDDRRVALNSISTPSSQKPKEWLGTRYRDLALGWPRQVAESGYLCQVDENKRLLKIIWIAEPSERVGICKEAERLATAMAVFWQELAPKARGIVSARDELANALVMEQHQSALSYGFRGEYTKSSSNQS